MVGANLYKYRVMFPARCLAWLIQAVFVRLSHHSTANHFEYQWHILYVLMHVMVASGAGVVAKGLNLNNGGCRLYCM